MSFLSGTNKHETRSEGWASVYAMLRDWEMASSSSSNATSLTDSQMTLPQSQSPVHVLVSNSNTGENSSLIANCSSLTYSDESTM